MFKKPDHTKSHDAHSHDAHPNKAPHEIKDARELAAKRAEELLRRAEESRETAGGNALAQGAHSAEEYQQLKKQLEELLSLKDRWIRQAADFENAKKRLQKDKDDFMKFANTNLIGGILPILRDLDRVVHHGQNQKQDPLVVGVEMVIKQFEKFLESNGLKRIESVGKAFDPHVHEAVNHIPSDHPAETVIEETEPGYLYHDRLVKPAKVVVSSGPAAGLSPAPLEENREAGQDESKNGEEGVC